MKLKRIHFKLVAISVIAVTILFTSSCTIPTQTEADVIEGLLEKLDSMEGEITLVTRNGEKINVKITKTPSDSEEGEKTGETDGKECVDPSSILPSLGSIEDVFKLLGKWEQAHEWREKGLTWSHIAAEFGFDPESLHAQLVEIAECELKDAKEEGLIDQELLEKKLAMFSDTAIKWVNKIFADVEPEKEEPVTDIESILPALESFEDVFKALGKWEQAHEWREEGLTWAHIARELGYNADTMYAQLVELGQSKLYKAKKQGLIGKDLHDSMLVDFSALAMDWVVEIFAHDE